METVTLVGWIHWSVGWATGDPYLAAGAVTRPKHPVMYLNQEADLIKVYCEGDKVLFSSFFFSLFFFHSISKSTVRVTGSVCLSSSYLSLF